MPFTLRMPLSSIAVVPDGVDVPRADELTVSHQLFGMFGVWSISGH